jgi:biopolymer transport protein TolQ
MNGEVELNILSIILESGFVVQFILLLLIVCSILSWGIIFLKWTSFKNITLANQEFLEVFTKTGSLKDVAQKTNKLKDSSLREVFHGGHEELVKIKSEKNSDLTGLKDHFKVFGLGIIDRGLKRGVLKTQGILDVHLSVLASIASVSPFIGLLGTVWGIIDSFRGLAGGGGTLQSVAPGIAEALVATAVGLFAAIPAVWFYNYFSKSAESMNLEMESFSEDFLNLVERSIIRQ